MTGLSVVREGLDPTDLMTVDEVCAHVRLSPWAVRRAIKRGELTAMKPAGRLRIPREAMFAWLEGSRVQPDIAGFAPVVRPLPQRFPRRSGRFRACLEDERARH